LILDIEFEILQLLLAVSFLRRRGFELAGDQSSGGDSG